MRKLWQLGSVICGFAMALSLGCPGGDSSGSTTPDDCAELDLPDLTVQLVSCAWPTATFSICNIGSRTAAGNSYKYSGGSAPPSPPPGQPASCPNGTTIGPSNVAVLGLSTGGLNPGECKVVDVIIADYPCAIGVVDFWIDSENQVAECNEGNNRVLFAPCP